MADNDPTTTSDSSPNQEQGSSPDYNKIATPQSGGKGVSSGVAGSRDLGTVGGGTITGADATMGSGNSPGGMSSSNSTIDSGGTTGRSNPGGGSTSDRGKMTDLDMAGGTRGNTVDPTAQSNIGGRNPDQPQTAMGDQDPRGFREDQRVAGNVTDPMTSRDPSKLNQNTPQDTQSA